MPTGRAISVASATSTSEPANAFASPSRTGPNANGTGFFVRRSRFSAGAPRLATDQTTTPRIETAISAAVVASPSIIRLTARRRGRLTARTSARVMPCELTSPEPSPVEADALASRDVAHDHLRGDVHQQREHEQDQREVDERRDLQVARRPLVGPRDLARERVTRREEVPVDRDGAAASADHLGDGDRLADRTPEPEDE